MGSFWKIHKSVIHLIREATKNPKTRLQPGYILQRGKSGEKNVPCAPKGSHVEEPNPLQQPVDAGKEQWLPGPWT